MKKYSLFLSLVLLFSSLLFSCTDAITPDVTSSGSGSTTGGGTSVSASVVGKWNMTGMSTITDKKTYTSTVSEIVAGIKQDSIDLAKSGGSLVFSPSNVNLLLTSAYTFEFKSDSTYVTTLDKGKWSLLADKKTIKITSSTGKSSTFEVISNTSTSLQLGMKKFTRTTPSDKFTPSDLTYFLDAVFGAYGIYGPKPSETEVDAFLSYQGTYNYTK
jgi:hypothetical protein